MRLHGKSRIGNPGGFTLMELMVVIFIISMLAAVIFPSFSGMGEKKLDAEARKIASLLRYLNDGAIYSKKTYSLEFDMRNGTLDWNGPDGEKSEQFKNLLSVELPSRGEIKDGQLILLFGPLGMGENIQVSLRNEDTMSVVSFNHISGRVKITESELF
jgi:general secretion pathway protein H